MSTRSIFEKTFENFNFNDLFYDTFNDNANDRVKESSDSIHFEIPLPGYVKEDVSIAIDSNILVISADIEEPTYFRKSFTKKFEVSSKYDIENTNAELKNGLLQITIGRTNKQKTIKIK